VLSLFHIVYLDYDGPSSEASTFLSLSSMIFAVKILEAAGRAHC